ncbi:MAG: HlyD family efflux transporter periplasmic adaptor subunit [Selenomonadaceae bacterium]|nr:HlyD family efflux transporter periplasmic adaptor subunit [Selenomonadaceae bacterium]
MGTLDITNRVKYIVKYGLVGLIVLSTLIGEAAFRYSHSDDTIKISSARVAGTMVSMRVLTNGKVKELTKSDGDEVKAGDVIAKIEVSVTEEQIQQLEKAVDLAKSNYAQLQVGQMVKVPVRKPKIPTVQTPPVQSNTSKKPTKSLAALEERKNRMELLYEMGAVSRQEMEAAVKEYELAKAAAAAPAPEPTAPAANNEVEYEIEYIEQLQPTPPEILNGAQLAIKQAELSLNVARQEAQQTEVVSPVDGIIYYSVEVDEEVEAGNIVARVGDSNELWLEAEVTESQFDKIALGKLVSYIIDGNDLVGTVIEKIAPSPKEEQGSTTESVEVTEVPAVAEASTTSTTDEIVDKQSTDSNTSTVTIDPAQLESNENPERKDKYIIKFSLPAERNFECKPNTNVAVTVKL